MKTLLGRGRAKCLGSGGEWGTCFGWGGPYMGMGLTSPALHPARQELPR